MKIGIFCELITFQENAVIGLSNYNNAVRFYEKISENVLDFQSHKLRRRFYHFYKSAAGRGEIPVRKIQVYPYSRSKFTFLYKLY